MTATAAETPLAKGVPERQSRWWVPVAALLLAAVGSVACLSAAGPPHGVLFGACGVAALLTPSLSAADRPTSSQTVLTTVGVAIGSLVGPATTTLAGDLNIRLLAAGVGVVGPLALALAGLTAVLILARFPAPVAAAIVTLLALAWLGWPVWLSPWLAGRDELVSWLSAAHPLLALDAAIGREGGLPWAEHRVMYSRLTVLGQHVFPRPPAGVGPAAAWHLAVGVMLLGLTAGAERVRRGRAGPTRD